MIKKSNQKTKKQEEKRYSLIVAPREEVARQLGLIRKNSEIDIEETAAYLGLSIDQLINLEKGNFEEFKHVSPHLHKYFDYLNATMTNLYENEQYLVNIPNTKKEGESLGKRTYWMAIDAYTTKFPNKDALLDDIKANGYLDIDPSVENKDLWVFIEYPRHNNFKPIALMYSEQTHLTDFISQNKFGYYFPIGNPFVDKFNEEIIQLFRPHAKTSDKVTPEFRKFVNSGYLPYYNQSLINTVRQSNKDPNYREDRIFFGGTSRYPNIRTHCIVHNLFDGAEPIISKNMIPFNERGEHQDEKPHISKVSRKEETVAPKEQCESTLTIKESTAQPKSIAEFKILDDIPLKSKASKKQLPGQMVICFGGETNQYRTHHSL